MKHDPDCDVCTICQSHGFSEPQTSYIHKLVEANYGILKVIEEADGEGIDLCSDEVEQVMNEIFPSTNPVSMN